jgi:hypothetical protein
VERVSLEACGLSQCVYGFMNEPKQNKNNYFVVIKILVLL